MKLFLKKILLFALPILVCLTVIFFKRTNREFNYNYIKGDCDARGKLFYKKLSGDCNNIDYLFVGSSKTMNGINDGLIDDSLNTGDTASLHLYNAGYCRFGRNLDYLYCKEFAYKNKIKKIFLEVRSDESTISHPMFAYLADGYEILEGITALNPKIFAEIYNHTLMNVNAARCVLKLEKSEKNKEKLQLHGWNNIDRILPKSELDKFYETEKKKQTESPVNTQAFEYIYSDFYLEKIRALCVERNIELNFVYLASFGNVSKEPAFKTKYEKWGKVIIGPDSIFSNPLYFKDVAHFNTAGSIAYSNFLAKELSR